MRWLRERQLPFVLVAALFLTSMTNFPASLDAFQNPGPSTPMDGAGFEHDVQHTNLNDAVLALQTKVGINGSSVSGSLDFRVAALEDGGGGGGGGQTFFETIISIGSGVNAGTVTGLGLSFTPTKIQLTMLLPSGGLVIIVVAASAPTTDGFSWQLTATTDNANYKFFVRLT